MMLEIKGPPRKSIPFVGDFALSSERPKLEGRSSVFCQGGSPLITKGKDLEKAVVNIFDIFKDIIVLLHEGNTSFLSVSSARFLSFLIRNLDISCLLICPSRSANLSIHCE